MSKSRRHQPEDFLRESEQPLPERGSLDPVPDFVPHVEVIKCPSHEPHYRTTLLPNDAEYAYVEVAFSGQEFCEHKFHNLTRFGDATCEWCGIEAWSPWWVADGVYSDDTVKYTLNVLWRWTMRHLGISDPAVGGEPS